MSVIGIEAAIAIVIASGGVAGAILWAMSRVDMAGRPGRSAGFPFARVEEEEEAVTDDISFLFHDVTLTHASDSAREIFARADPADTDWARVVHILGRRFPGVPDQPDPRNGGQALMLPSVAAGDRSRLKVVQQEDVTRLTLVGDRRPTAADRHMRLFRQWELETLRGAALHAPNPIWLTDRRGHVLWMNEPYLRLARLGGRKTAARAGEPALLDNGLPLPEEGERSCARVRLDRPGHVRPLWYDVTVIPSRLGWMHFATDVTPVVQAEIAQRNFVQTLSKTFAQLSTGLAIFDRDQRLALFNPALLDLTGLQADFLSRQPGYRTFFDALRDRQMMPEPKSYASWRDRVSTLFAAAQDGTFEETWTLPAGTTYRVIGRPHPEGAVAFMIEDISAEITLTRQFRHQLELEQAVLDAMDEAIVVFSTQGNVSFSNAAYRALWGIDTDCSLLDVTVVEATRHWQDRCQATPFWGEVRDFVSAYGPRADWSAQVHLADGTPIGCRVQPLPGGTTLVTFRSHHAPAQRQAESVPA